MAADEAEAVRAPAVLVRVLQAVLVPGLVQDAEPRQRQRRSNWPR